MNLKSHRRTTRLTDREIRAALWILCGLFVCFVWKFIPKQEDPTEHYFFPLYMEVKMTWRWYVKLLGEYAFKTMLARGFYIISTTEFMRQFITIWFAFQSFEFVAFFFWYNIDLFTIGDFGVSITTIKFCTLTIYFIYKLWR